MIATRSILNGQVDKECPFCLNNGLIPKEKIIRKGRWGALVTEYSQVVPGTLQLVPKWHEMNLIKWLLFLSSALWLGRKVDMRSFNISINFGSEAGQTLPHLHIWFIPREGRYAGKGLAHFVSLEAQCRTELGMPLGELVKNQLPTRS